MLGLLLLLQGILGVIDEQVEALALEPPSPVPVPQIGHIVVPT